MRDWLRHCQRAIASLIEETLSNHDWTLGKLAAGAEMSVERINELLEGDRAYSNPEFTLHPEISDRSQK